jgi:hypothetical protein
MESHSSWDEVGDLEDEKEDQEREWKLRHLDIPFIRLPHREDGRTNMWKIRDNQESIKEMVEKNPLFKEGRYREMWLDHQDPTRVQKRIDQQLRDHKAVLDRMERWQVVAQQEQEAERRKRSGGLFLRGNQVVNGEGYVLGNGRPITIQTDNPLFTGQARPEQNLGQWMRDIEADEGRRIQETPTQRRTRERRE